MTGRLPCEVPHCRRTVKDEGKFTAWICGKHWGATPKTWRRRRALFRRRGRIDLANRMWDRIRARAIELAVGL